MKTRLWSVIAFGVTAASYLLAQRFAVRAIGMAQFGAWATIYGVALLFRAFDLNVGIAITKFASSRYATNRQENAHRVIWTGVWLAAIMAAAASVGFLATARAWANLFRASELIDNTTILLLGLFTFLFSFTTALQGLLEAEMKYKKIAVNRCCGALVFVVVVYVTVKTLPLYALSFGLITQFAVTGGLNLVTALRKEGTVKPSMRLGRKMLFFSARIQASQLLMPLVDPFVKLCLSWAASFEFIAIYEIINRLLMQLRQVVLAASQVDLPSSAYLKHERGERDEVTWAKKRGEVVLALYACVACVLVPVSAAIIGVRSEMADLLIVVLVLVSGWWVNACAIPKYYENIGQNSINENERNQKLLFGLLLAIVPLGGMLFGGRGVVVGLALTLMISGVALVVGHRIGAVLGWGRKVGVSARSVIGVLLVVSLVVPFQVKLLLDVEASSSATRFGLYLVAGLLILFSLKAVSFFKERRQISFDA